MPKVIINVTYIMTSNRQTSTRVTRRRHKRRRTPNRNRIRQPRLRRTTMVSVERRRHGSRPSRNYAHLRHHPTMVTRANSLTNSLVRNGTVTLLNYPTQGHYRDRRTTRSTRRRMDFVNTLRMTPGIFRAGAPLSFVKSPTRIYFTHPRYQEKHVLLRCMVWMCHAARFYTELQGFFPRVFSSYSGSTGCLPRP